MKFGFFLVLAILFGLCHSLSPFDSISNIHCVRNISKLVTLQASKVVGNVQTTDTDLFKTALGSAAAFNEMETLFNQFLLSRYGIDLRNVSVNPLSGNGSFGQPYKHTVAADVYTLTFNHFLVQEQHFAAARGIFGGSLMEDGIPNCANSRIYLFEVLFNVTHLQANPIGGSFGEETGGFWDPTWLSTFYGTTNWSWQVSNNLIFTKNLTLCGLSPSVSDLKHFPFVVELLNRPMYVDEDDYGVGDGTIHEFQMPGFTFAQADPIDFRFVNTVVFPTMYYRDYGVSNKTCIPAFIPSFSFKRNPRVNRVRNNPNFVEPYSAADAPNPRAARMIENYNNLMRNYA